MSSGTGIQTSYPSAPPAGYSGDLVGGGQHVTTPAINADAVSIPFGKAVCFLRTSPATDFDCVLPGTETVPMGIVVRDGSHAPAVTLTTGDVTGDLDSTGLVVGAHFRVLRKGRILVTVATAVVPGDRLYIRKVAGGGETYGAIENASDSSDMIDCTAQGQFMSTAGIGGLAELEVDFTNRDA